MKKLFLLIILIGSSKLSFSQCSTSNTTGCECLGGAISCDLLPDITLSRDLLLDPSENPETAPNFPSPGKVGVSVGTPNIGHGTFEVRTTTRFVCGSDTFYGSSPTLCPDGSDPKQIITQRVYQKSTSTTVSYYDRDAGTMTYHPSHGHMHVDDWGTYSLRIPTADPDPENWPIVGNGSKLGFCLMDFGGCSDASYLGYCKDNLGNTLLNSDFPNFGLGGGGYGCSSTVQGITSGYLDIYHYYLDGMTFDLLPGTCNGDYAIVVRVDPQDFFLEEDETNNIMWVPYTLSNQSSSTTSVPITSEDPLSTCAGQTVTLSVPAIGSSYLWSTGETTSTIEASVDGDYTCTIATPCGNVNTSPVSVNINTVSMPMITNQTVCLNEVANLEVSSASPTTTYNWYASMSATTPINSGNTYNTPSLTTTTSYYVEAIENFSGISGNAGPSDNTIGTVGTSSSPHYLTFDVLQSCILNKVDIYTTSSGSKTIQLLDNSGAILQEATVTHVVGLNTVDLNFNLTTGSNYILTLLDQYNEVQRNITGASFPYLLSGLVNITGTDISATSPNVYYHFYNWKVSTPDLSCPSVRTEVIATVDPDCMGVSVEELNARNLFSIFPNPCVDVLNIQFNTNIIVEQIQILDMQGRIMQDLKNLNSSNSQININSLSSGIYFIQLKSNGKYHTQKFVKK